MQTDEPFEAAYEERLAWQISALNGCANARSKRRSALTLEALEVAADLFLAKAGERGVEFLL